MNNGSWLPDEDFKGLTDHFFDDLIDHIDFPLEDIETGNDEDNWDAAGFQDLIPPPLDVLTSFSSEFTCGKGQRVGVQKPVSSLKQLSSLEVSSTVDSTAPDVKVSKIFQSSSPVSVLDNANGSASSQNQGTAQRLAFSVKGVRGKRKPPTQPRFRFLKSFISAMFQQLASVESESETYLSSEKSSAKKKRKKNKTRPTHSISYNPEPYNWDGTIRKCTHCETTKTPQWREGPCGPKTLCNACGVRFKSGRLVPEYRPASSPTFIPTVHSNSHRKIIEMRRKGEDQFDTGMMHHAVSSRA